MSMLKIQLFFEFSGKARERLYRKLAQLLKNGVSLDRALEQIAMIEEKRGNTGTSTLLRRWRNAIENGTNFGQAVAPFVPSSEALLLETGGNSGRLQDAFMNAAESVAQQRRVKGAIISSGSYPALLILVLIAMLVMMSYNIIPAFAEVLPLEEWQGSAAFIASLSAKIRANGVYYFGAFVAVIVVISYSLPRWTGRTRMLVEKIAPWSIYRMQQGSSLLLSVAALMASGVKIDDNALKRISVRSSPYLKERVTAIARQLTSGHNLGDAMSRTGFKFPEEELIDDLRIYATLKGFEENLTAITREWVGEVEGKVTAAMKVLNTVALVLIAVTLGTLISSIFGVVQQIQDSANAPVP